MNTGTINGIVERIEDEIKRKVHWVVSILVNINCKLHIYILLPIHINDLSI